MIIPEIKCAACGCNVDSSHSFESEGFLRLAWLDLTEETAEPDGRCDHEYTFCDSCFKTITHNFYDTVEALKVPVPSSGN